MIQKEASPATDENGNLNALWRIKGGEGLSPFRRRDLHGKINWRRFARKSMGLPVYDVLVTSAIIGSFIGIISGTVLLERHRREIRITKQIKADPFLDGIKLPKYLLRLFEATFRHDK